MAPQDAEIHFKLALALNETGDTAHLLTELEVAVKCNPRHAQPWYNLGLARSGQGDDSGALAALVRAESAEQSDPRAPYPREVLCDWGAGASGKSGQA